MRNFMVALFMSAGTPMSLGSGSVVVYTFF